LNKRVTITGWVWTQKSVGPSRAQNCLKKNLDKLLILEKNKKKFLKERVATTG
jgi:hypothetical protein